MPGKKLSEYDAQAVVTLLGRSALFLLWWLPLLPYAWSFFLPGVKYPLTEPGIGISDASRGEILVLALLALAFSGARFRFRGRGISWPGWWGLAFIVHTLISCLLNSEMVKAFFFAQNWLAAACVYLAVPYLRPERLTLRVKICWLYLPLVAICLLSLSESSYRVAGPFQLPGVLASWLLMLAPPTFHELFTSKRLSSAAVALVPSVLAAVTLLMTVSRAAWLVMLFGLVGLLLLEGRCSWKRLFGWGGFWVVGLAGLVAIRGAFSGFGLLLSVALLAALPFAAETFSRRISLQVAQRALLLFVASALLYGGFSTHRTVESDRATAGARWEGLAGSDNSAVSRIELWRTGLALGLENPIWGVGPGRYGEAYPQVQTLYYYYSDSAHNAVCEMAADLGLVGLAVFALWLFWEGKAIGMRPQDEPWQRGLFVGVVSALVYAQFEVSYHFAYLWVVLAVLMSSLRAPAARPRVSLWLTLGWLLLLLVPLSVLPTQRAYLLGSRELTDARAYTQLKAVSDRLPAWSAPALAALGLGLSQDIPPQELQPLAQRGTRWASKIAASHQMAGDLAFKLKNYGEAKDSYELALKLDPFNLPGTYHGLLLVAEATDDDVLKQQITERALARYDLSKWPLTHLGHRAQLLRQLAPLLYDIADGMSPYEQPEKTEPLYRFLLEHSPRPRAMHGLGVSLMQLGRLEEARIYLGKAHELDPVYPPLP